MRIHLIILLLPIIVMFGCLPVLLQTVWYNKKFNKPIVRILLVLYILLVLFLTLTDVNLGMFVSIKFNYSADWCNKTIYLFEKFDIMDLLINLAMLIPVGLMIWDRNRSLALNCLKSSIFGCFIGFCVETLQFVLPVNRTVQIQDIIINTGSAIIGTILMWLIIKLFVHIFKKDVRYGDF